MNRFSTAIAAAALSLGGLSPGGLPPITEANKPRKPRVLHRKGKATRHSKKRSPAHASRKANRRVARRR